MLINDGNDNSILCFYLIALYQSLSLFFLKWVLIILAIILFLETCALLKYSTYLLVCYHSKLHKNLHHKLFITANLV